MDGILPNHGRQLRHFRQPNQNVWQFGVPGDSLFSHAETLLPNGDEFVYLLSGALDLLLEHDVNHIDTAARYGDSELLVGRWMPRHRARFVARHPGAAGYADFRDFAFWRMTPRELAAAMRGPLHTRQPSFESDALKRLMREFPDEDMSHG